MGNCHPTHIRSFIDFNILKTNVTNTRELVETTTFKTRLINKVNIFYLPNREKAE